VTAWLELKDYPIQPDGSVAAVHLTMYFDELRTAWHENKNAKEMGTDDKNEVPPLITIGSKIVHARENSCNS